MAGPPGYGETVVERLSSNVLLLKLSLASKELENSSPLFL